jgi:hypothetical protein
MYVVLGIAAAVVLAVVGVLVFAGGDDDERIASEDTEQTEETDPADADEPEATEPPGTDEPTDTTPADTEAPDDPTAATEPPDTEPTDEPSEPSGDVIAGAPAGAFGTRDAPVGVGEVADIGSGWRLQILDVVPDATGLIAAENTFNDPPPPGSTFTIVRIALGYFGLEDPQSFFMPTISAIGAEAVELDTSCGVIPDQLDLFADAFAGGVTVGNICFVTTPADPPVLQLYASGDFFGDTEVFLAATAPPAPVTPMATIRGAQPGAAATEQRAAANPIGTAVEVGSGWSFAVVGPARDITDQVLSENTFNTPPPDGLRMVGVDVALAYNGSGTGSAFDVTMNWVDDDNVERTGYCGVVPGELDQFSDVFAGGSVTGTLCFLVPADLIGTGSIYVNVGFDDPAVWFRTT